MTMRGKRYAQTYKCRLGGISHLTASPPESSMAFPSILHPLLHGLLLIPFYFTLTSAHEAPSESGCPPEDPFNWESVRSATFCMREGSNRAQISPCKSIDWTPCYETYFCARFKVQFNSANLVTISLMSLRCLSTTQTQKATN